MTLPPAAHAIIIESQALAEEGREMTARHHCEELSLARRQLAENEALIRRFRELQAASPAS